MKIINIAPQGVGACAAVWREEACTSLVAHRTSPTHAPPPSARRPVHLPGGEGGVGAGGNGTRMVFPSHHRRRAANEGYEIYVGAASHMPEGQAQPCVL